MPWTRSSTLIPTDLVTVDQAKQHLGIRLSEFADDGRLKGVIGAAYEQVENYTGRSLVQATYAEVFDDFPAIFRPSQPPLVSVTSITYFDENNVLQTVSSTVYDVDNVSRPGRVALSESASWPSVRSRLNAVTLNHISGSTAIGLIPERAREAILLTVGNWNENREAVIAGTIASELPQNARDLLDELWTGAN